MLPNLKLLSTMSLVRNVAAAVAAVTSVGAGGYYMGRQNDPNYNKAIKTHVTQDTTKTKAAKATPMPSVERMETLNDRAKTRMKEALEGRTVWDSNWDM